MKRSAIPGLFHVVSRELSGDCATLRPRLFCKMQFSIGFHKNVIKAYNLLPDNHWNTTCLESTKGRFEFLMLENHLIGVFVG